MIPRRNLLPCCIAIAGSLFIGKSEGFSNAGPLSNRVGQQTLVQPHVLSSSTVDEYDLASTGVTTIKKQKRVTASPASSYGKSNADELTAKIESEFPKRKIKASVRETGTDSMKYYIKSMCNHELLNKNEEIILAREIQILLKWEAQREKLEEELLR